MDDLNVDFTEDRLSLPKEFNILENGLNAIFIYKNDRVVYLNQNAKAVFGFDDQFDFTNFSFTNLISDYYLGLFEEGIDKVIPINRIIRLKMCHLNGSILDMRVSVICLFNENGEKIYKIECQDLQDYTKISHVHMMCEEKLRKIIDVIEEAVIVIDETGIIQTMNMSCSKMFRYEKHEIVGCNISKLMPAPFNKHHKHFIESYLVTGRSRVFHATQDLYAKRADGEVFPVEISVIRAIDCHNKQSFTGVIKDMSYRQKIE